MLLAAFQGGDRSWTSTVLLMGFEGANGSTGSPGMNDESHANRGLATTVDNTTIDTSQFEAGVSSAKMSGTSSGIGWATSADWGFGSGNYTIEAFVKFNVVSGQIFFVANFGNSPNWGWVLFWDGTNLAYSVSTVGTDYHPILAAAWTPDTSNWHHVCVDFDGTSTRLYLDGVFKQKNTAVWNINNPSGQMTLGMNAIVADNFNGWMDEVRITKGVARYASDGGFTVPLVPFPRHA
jgi:hypothetical protein